MEDILENLDIGEAQATEKAAIDKVVSATLASIDELDWPTDLDELGEAETEKLLRASEGEDEKKETMEMQPPTNISGAPSQFVDIRTKMEEARNASLKSLAVTAAAKLARRRHTPRRPPMPAASTIRPPANYIPPVTAVSMHTEGEAGPPKIACLMSLVIPALEESPPHYTQEPATYYAGYYSRPLTVFFFFSVFFSPPPILILPQTHPPPIRPQPHQHTILITKTT